LSTEPTIKPRMTLDAFRSAANFSALTKLNVDRSRIVPGDRAQQIGLDAFNRTLQMVANDTFNNSAARIGFGTNNLLEGTNYPLTRLTYNWYLLISLYRNEWLVSKMIDGIAEAMVNKWISFPTDLEPKKVKKIEQAFTNTGTQEKVLKALKWARLFGGAGAVMIIKDQQLDQPLDLESVGLDSFKGLIVFDRWSGISPSAQVSSDLDRPLDYGLPETYRINLEQGGSMEVHASRVLRFTGRIMPAWEFQADQRWGVSEVERAYMELNKRTNTSYNIASLVFRANIFELRQKGLSSMISGLNSGGQQAQTQLMAALNAQAALMSNQGIIVSDPEGGGLSTHQYGFAGIAEVYKLFQRDWCAATEYPYSMMFGHEGGLGANGEGDEHAFFDMIGQRQNRELDPQFMKLVPVVAMSTWGKVPDDLEWVWNPVNNPSDKQKAELGTANTTAVVEAFNAGIISQKTAGSELKQASSVTGLFTNITDEDIQKMSDEALGGEMQEAGLVEGGEGGDLQGGEGLTDKPGKKEKSLEKPRKVAKDAIEDTFPHNLRHPDTGHFTKRPLEHLKFAGLPIVIENPVGSTRSGDGWSVTMKHPYGYIAHTEGADGDEVDVFLGPNEQAEKVYVIHTKNPKTLELDEDKIFVGFADAEAAISSFFDNYSDRRFMAGIEMVHISELVGKLKHYRGRLIAAYDRIQRS
jgi:phage-related protein (TIGR01555 family)